jgi:hypothetical protein
VQMQARLQMQIQGSFAALRMTTKFEVAAMKCNCNQSQL